MSEIHFAPFLKTSRLTLRLYQKNDAEFIATTMGAIFTPDNIQKLCFDTLLHESIFNGRKTLEPAIYMIHLGTSEGPQIGYFTICQRKKGFPPDIGWRVLDDYHRQGIATEAAKECLRYFHEEWEIKDICMITSDENIASQKIAGHLGFVKKGHLSVEGVDGSQSINPLFGFKSMKEYNGELVKFWGEPELEDRV